MHVMVRGNNRETLFFTDEDRRTYLSGCATLQDNLVAQFMLLL